MLKLNHKNLKVWKKGILLVKEVYLITRKFPAVEKYGLISQMRRAAVSVPSNIAEGASRRSENERKRFYEIARSSLVELDTQIEIAIELEFVNKNETEKIDKLANEIFAMLSAMV